MTSDRPVGVWDSGLGGLTVLHEIRRLLPHEDLLYVSDSGHCPYGGRSEAFVQARAQAISSFLVEQGAKVVVVACNAATAAAVPLLRSTFSAPIIGMEPAIKPAVAASRTGVIGVLATVVTARSERLTNLIQRFGRDVQVITQACPGLVEQVEQGDLAGPRTRELLEQYATPLIERGADVLVLGCTHYPFLRPTLQAMIGPEVVLIDTGAAVARQTERVLLAQGLERGAGNGSVRMWTSASSNEKLSMNNYQTGTGSVRMWTSASPVAIQAVVERLWSEPCAVQALPAAVAI